MPCGKRDLGVRCVVNAIEDRHTAVTVHDLSKTYPGVVGRMPVLRSLSFDVASGGWTTLIGPSGCGKTTLLRIVAGLIPADEGTVRIDGASAPRAGSVSYLPQHDTLLPWRTALDNAVLAWEISGRPTAEAHAAARSLFERFGLAGFEAHYPLQLSGGMRQRVAVIRSFLVDRSILLLDEPLGALDPLTRTSMQDWLYGVWSEMRKTIVLVTHDVEEALMLSDEIHVLGPRPASIRKTIRIPDERPRQRTSPSYYDGREQLLRLLFGDLP